MCLVRAGGLVQAPIRRLTGHAKRDTDLIADPVTGMGLDGQLSQHCGLSGLRGAFRDLVGLQSLQQLGGVQLGDLIALGLLGQGRVDQCDVREGGLQRRPSGRRDEVDAGQQVASIRALERARRHGVIVHVYDDSSRPPIV